MKKKFFKALCAVLAPVMAIGCLSACGGTGSTTVSTPHVQNGLDDETQVFSGSAYFKEGEHPRVKFTMENGNTFMVELYPEYAPITVDNFLGLVNSGFYNGRTFHRVVDDFMAQGGAPNDDGSGDFGKQIYGEFAANGCTANTLAHERGVISMARTNDMNSASCQFFICYSDTYRTALDGRYAAFGKVIEGMETVDSFLAAERTMNTFGEIATPVTPIRMKTVEQLPVSQ